MEKLNCRELLAEQSGWSAVLAATACCTGAVFCFVKWKHSKKIHTKIQKAVARREQSKLDVENAVLQFRKQHPEAKSAPVLSLSLTELSKQLKEGSLTPATVLHTYMEKALEVTTELNCVTEFLLESRDQLQEVEKYKEGLLYGIPISIKDNVAYQGHDSTCGVSIKLDCPEKEDSVVVQVLKRQGAIPFVKTNIPQGLLNYDCSNPIFGQSLNPHNQQKTPGGSSGGEGALIGGGGSLLGIGTDIGGSIRIPASFCGICGLKPTGGRLSDRGLAGCLPGQKSVTMAPGPMGRDVDSLALFMKAVLSEDMFLLDPCVPPIPFNDEVYSSSKTLRIGYYDTDGYLVPSPSMRRAVLETKALLEKAGHTLVPFTPPRIAYAMQELIVKGILADGGSTLLHFLREERIDPALKPQIITYRIPRIVKKIISLIMKPLFPRISTTYESLNGISSVQDLWKKHVDVADYCKEYIAQWRSLGLDVMLCPALGPAFKFGYPGKLSVAASYTILYNLLNFPAGVVPVSKVTEQDEEELKHYKGYYGDPWDKLFKEAVTGCQGLPVAVQCVALPWQEELCLRFMKEVESLTQGTGKN